MKRVLRVVILGPIWFVVVAAVLATSPLIWILSYLLDARDDDLFRDLGEMFLQGCRTIWYGPPA